MEAYSDRSSSIELVGQRRCSSEHLSALPNMKARERYAFKTHATIAFAMIVSGMMVLIWILRPLYMSSTSTIASCGSTPDHARAQNCSFDIISFAWQRPQCYDETLITEFLAWSNWTYFSDPSLSIPVHEQQARQGDKDLFVDWQYHTVHCTFMWRRMHRSLETGWIDGHLSNYSHTLHCQNVLLLDEVASTRYVTLARVNYPECHPIEALKMP